MMKYKQNRLSGEYIKHPLYLLGDQSMFFISVVFANFQFKQMQCNLVGLITNKAAKRIYKFEP